MARIRTVKPEFFLDDELGQLPALTRLLFIGLWCLADRDGRLEDKPAKIKVQVLPYDDMDINKALEQLEAGRYIIRYEVEGRKVILVRNFAKHQVIHHTEKESEFPDMINQNLTINGEVTVKQRDGIGEVTVNEPLHSRKERKGKEVERKGKEGKGVWKGKEGAKNGHTHTQAVFLKTIEELEAAIDETARAALCVQFGFYPPAMEEFAKKWIRKKQFAGDFIKYPVETLKSFFIQDACKAILPADNKPKIQGILT